MNRVAHLTLLFANAIAAMLLREYGSYAILRLSSILHVFKDCDPYVDAGQCFGNQLVYRMSFSLGVFFLLATLLSCASARGCDSCCCLVCFQLPLYLFILGGSLFIPNGFFDGYVDVARVLSGLFIVFQIVIIVDWAYILQDFFLDKMESAERDQEARQALLESNYDSLRDHDSRSSSPVRWEAAYLALTLVSAAIAVALIVVMFKTFGGCELNIVFISITLVVSIFLVVLSVVSWTNVGLLPATTVILYLVMLCFQSVKSNPDEMCSAIDAGAAAKADQPVTNALIAAATITWTSWRTSATSTHLLTLSPSTTSKAQDESVTSGEGDDHLAVGQGDDSTTAAVPEYQFHLLLILSSFYMAMVITSWGSSNGLTSDGDRFTSMWVKAISEWAAAGLFLWTLIAPSVFPDRDFGVERF